MLYSVNNIYWHIHNDKLINQSIIPLINTSISDSTAHKPGHKENKTVSMHV